MTSQPTIRGPVADELFLPLLERRWDDLDEEMCFHGAAGTAKSFQVMLSFVAFMTQPDVGGFRLLWSRKTRKAITQSSLVTHRKVHELLGLPWSAKPAPTHRQSEVYRTPAGTNELIWCGMDDPMNLFSTEYDAAVTEEGIQVSLDTYENSILRTLRNFSIPKQFSIVLTNPGPKASWLYKRMNQTPDDRDEPFMASYWTKRQDNPAYYDEDGEATLQGAAYERTLDRYTGGRRDRLRDGLWGSEEGMVLSNWVEELHTFRGQFVIPRYGKPYVELTEEHSVLPERIEIEWTFGSMDLGFVNAGVLQAWGVTKEGTMLLLEECYHTEKDRDWWAERILDFSGRYLLDSIVADHDEERHRHWNATIDERAPARKSFDGQPFVRKCEKSRGQKDELKADVVRTLLNSGLGQIPRCFLNADARAHPPDPGLLAEAKPTCTLDEIEQLIWKELDPDQADDKLPEEKFHPGRANHGIDAWVYAGRHARQRSEVRDWPQEPEWPTDSFEHHLEHLEGKKPRRKRWGA
ncbi:MAG: phage terminase large subunit [Planctomycetota bacterium]